MASAKQLSLAEVAHALGVDYRGDGSCLLSGIAPLSSARAGQLSFLANRKYASALATSEASAVILPPSLADEFHGHCLLSDDPYLMFARASALFDPVERPRAGVHPTAVVMSEGVHPSASIGANCVVEADVVIGEGTVLGPGTVVGADSRIGRNCYLHANVTLYHGVTLGDEVNIHSGTVIGGDGFGFAPSADGWVKIHQLGGVRIGNRVEIGANCCIDRGALDDTIIEDGVIMDDQIMIAHNVVVGAGTAMAGCCQVAGSAVIGKRCTLAGNVGVVGHITICDGVHVTARTMVTRSIKEPGSFSSGTPMMDSGQWRKSAARFSKLDELHRRVVALERQVKNQQQEDG